MWDLAPSSPESLVAAFEIIEMQQEYNDRRALAQEAQLADDAPEEAPDSPSSKSSKSGRSDPGLFENIRGLVQSKLRHYLEEKVEQEFEMLSNFTESENMSKASALTMAANQVLQKLLVFKEETLPCIPPSYDAMAMFIETFETHLMPRMDDLLDNIHDLKVADILDCINWIEYHSICMEEFGQGTRNSISDLKATKHDLLTEYKDRIKTQVESWFENIKKIPSEIVRASDGTLITSNPEDMFNIIHVQLQVAREKLPSEYSKEVAIACLQVLGFQLSLSLCPSLSLSLCPSLSPSLPPSLSLYLSLSLSLSLTTTYLLLSPGAARSTATGLRHPR